MLGPSTPPSVLIVDDELGPRESIRLVLEPRFRTITAESGEQALDLLRHQRVDVVTLDLMMPGLGGIETFKKIREMDAELQILVVSGGILDLARALPATAPSAWIIPKPFDSGRLLEAVAQAAEETRRCRLRAAELLAPASLDACAPAFEVGNGRKYDAARLFSRDIRNRLDGVLGFVRLLREGQLDRRHTARALEVIEGNTHEAAALTMNFLHTVESDGAALYLHKTPAALNHIVEEVMEDETPRARSRGIEFRADLDLRLPSSSLDVAMIARALTNLLSNALHHSPEGGIVSVETRRFGDVMLLRVRHQGAGIPAEEVAGLFERYGRGAKSAGDSTGMGLYLVRKIVEAHGGSVFTTTPPGGGSALVISLPCPLHDNA